MTAFLQCFWISPQIVFASIRNLMSSFGKASDPFCTEIPWASLIYLSNFSNFGTWFPDCSDSRPNKMCFGARWRVCLFFTSNILPICLRLLKRFHKLSLMLHKSWSYIPSRQYGISPFWKTNRNIFERGIGEIRIFIKLKCLLNCLLDCLLACLLDCLLPVGLV